MIATTAQRGHQETASPTLSRPVAISLGLHAIAVLIAIFGLPYLTAPTPPLEEPIPIEVVTVAAKSHVNKPAATPVKVNTPKPAPPKPVKPPTPPTKTSDAPPKSTEIKPTPLKSEAAPTPDEDALAPPKKTVKKMTPPKKPAAPKPDPKKAAEQQQDFNALLKNMIKTDPVQATQDAPEKAAATPTPNATLSDEMTMSEMDAVRQQLGQCWKLLAGARYAEDLVVEIDMTMNADKTVAGAKIVDQGRYNSNTFFRAAADSAMRAVYDPHCNPLTSLPDGKVAMWKDLDVKFDPREMLQ